jgi:hypothetical protein
MLLLLDTIRCAVLPLLDASKSIHRFCHQLY